MVTRHFPVFLVVLLLSLVAVRANAGDLQLQFVKENNSFTLTNNLAVPVYVLFLEGTREERIPVHTKIEAGKKAVIPLRELSLPDKLLDAACTFMGAPPAGMVRGTDGKFHLSVDPA
jgi:hypothetical protein